MVVLFAPLGFTAKLALAPLRDHPDIDTVHIFYGGPMKAEAKEALKACRSTTDTLGVSLVEHKVKDVFDYANILEALTTAYAATTEDVIVNASGGTRPMIMAATIFAFTHDVPLVYYDEYETTQGKLIPLRAYRALPGLGVSQQAILHRLEKGSADMGTLAHDIGLAPSTLSVHIQRLTESGLVTVEKHGKHRIVSVVPEIKRFAAEAAS
jgi:CRISPR locus-related DNA-binding protein